MDGRDSATAWRQSTRASPSRRSTRLQLQAAVSRTRDERTVRDGAAVAGRARTATGGASASATLITRASMRTSARTAASSAAAASRARTSTIACTFFGAPKGAGRACPATSCSTASGSTGTSSRGPRRSRRSCTSTTTPTLRGGWQAGASVLVETFAFDERLYGDYALESRGARRACRDPAVRRHAAPAEPRLRPDPQHAAVLRASPAAFSYLWGRDENFFEWSSGGHQVPDR